MARGEPLLKKRITSELGNVSAVLVVPGPWTEADLEYQGRNVAGMVTIGEQVMVAIGSTIRDRVAIGDRAVIGAGSVVVNDVAADTTVVGVPARPLERVSE